VQNAASVVEEERQLVGVGAVDREAVVAADVPVNC
jgi:hypothetical protein